MSEFIWDRYYNKTLIFELLEDGITVRVTADDPNGASVTLELDKTNLRKLRLQVTKLEKQLP